MEYDKDKVDEFTLALPCLMVHRYNSIAALKRDEEGRVQYV